ncbi:MAG: FeoB-associated Cys-rich membrane protein [Prevotella sp.]|nr:FeoB-associated Cys-rich membrane protein [Prevotella sp.]
MQTTLVVISIVLALAYAAYRIHRTFRQGRNPCNDCPGCSLKQGNITISHCEKKKDSKKFG